MPEYSDFRKDPLAKALKKRSSKLVRQLAKHKISYKQLYKIQESIIRELTSVEEGLSFFREQMKDARRASSEMALQIKAVKGKLSSVDKEAIRSMQLEAEDYAYSLRIMRYGRWLLRYIADGVAWKAFHYNRMIIGALGAKEPVPFISKKGDADLRYGLYQAGLIASFHNAGFRRLFNSILDARQGERGIRTKMRVKMSAKLLVIVLQYIA